MNRVKTAVRAATPEATTMDQKITLSVKDLCVDYSVGGEPRRIVDGFSLDLKPAERVALVGESGSGKSVTARSLMRLDRHALATGSIMLEGTELLALSEAQMRRVRGTSIGMVFQNPLSALDPLKTIGDQVTESLRIRGVSRRERDKRAISMLDELAVHDASRRLRAYPHEFSGGMRQRVVIAMALIGRPKVLIADEPTTALDVRVQEQVLKILDEVTAHHGTSVLLITHDLGIVAGFADRVAVMYSGRKVEEATTRQLFSSPAHPYTQGLLAAVPRIDRDVERLSAIPGAPPSPNNRPSGCAFRLRCPAAMEVCRTHVPVHSQLPESTQVACHLYTETERGAHVAGH
ncbi:ABC transporter ATP-binding protein [Paenarthrobacter nicotinovorans]|uniref:ABC transporter ATP-binding protein n=1 Tax=Paenarthrobacter nicotinovorans TaxID=29320 RepID=UPI00374A3C9A